MFRLSNNSHLQVVHETLGNCYTKFNMGCVQCGVVGVVVSVRDLVCVMGLGGTCMG